MQEQVILVDELDNELGYMEKMEAHQAAMLHRAFSVFLFDKNGRMLLQKRALNKYHSPGLWTNTCCSHPRPGEQVESAAKRRLMEEMGIEAKVQPAFNFIYKAQLDQGLTEHELDYVVVGEYEGVIIPNSLEVCNYLYATIHEIQEMLEANAEQFTVWFRIAFPKVVEWYNLKFVNN
jgi:isopentenyl-diphosphate delta-isomerase